MYEHISAFVCQVTVFVGLHLINLGLYLLLFVTIAALQHSGCCNGTRKGKKRKAVIKKCP